MNPHSWLRNVFNSRSPRTIRKTPVRFRPFLERLEDRCLLSGPGGVPITGSLVSDLSQLFWNGGDKRVGAPWTGPAQPTPAVKTITITNNTNQTIFPFIRDANTGQDTNNPNLPNPNNPGNYYDPMDPTMKEFREYIGYYQGSQQYLGLPAQSSIEIKVPLAFWDAANLYVATDGTYLTPSDTSTSTNNPFGYSTSALRGVSKESDSSSWVSNYTTPGQTSNGLVMFYYDGTTSATVNPGAPAQLTEYTIRDPYLKNWLTDPAQTKVIFGYNVSYVDNLSAPLALEAYQVPVPIPGNTAPPAPSFGWLGTTLTYGTPTDPQTFEKSVSDFINNTGDASIGQYFGGQGWPSYNIPNSALKIPSGANIFVNSPLNNQRAVYDTYGPNNEWLLSSSGPGPIQTSATAKFQLSTGDETVLPLSFIDSNQQNTFFNNLSQMLGPQKTNVVYFEDSRSPAVNLGTVVDFSNDASNPTVTVAHPGVKLPTDAIVTWLFTRKTTDYASTDITNLWYTWGQYYVNQFTGVQPFDAPGSVSLPGAGATQGAVLTLDNPPTTPLAVGMTVTSDAKGGYNGRTVTILQVIDATHAYLSQFPDNNMAASGTYTIGPPQPLPFSSPTGIQNITITNGGSGYSNDPTKPPSVTISSASGSGATAVAVVNGGQITNIVLTNGGSGYKADVPITIDIGGPGSGASAQATVGTYINLLPLSFPKDQQAYAKEFAGSVYEAMATESTLPNYTLKQPNLPAPMSLVFTVIFTNTSGLPNSNGGASLIGRLVTQKIISILNGVPDYTNPAYLSNWYPNPAADTGNLGFNSYNLDPYVWFVHKVLNMSGYGFSVDDDSSFANAQGSDYAPDQGLPSNLQVVVSKTNGLDVTKPWYPTTQWGQQNAMATISPGANGKAILTLEPQYQTVYFQVAASSPGKVGAYVTSTTAGMIPAGTTLDSNGVVDQLQFILSGPATATTTPIPVTFTGFRPKALLTTPPPVTSPLPPINLPPPSNTVSGSTPSVFQEVATLVQNEYLLFAYQVLAFVEVTLGIRPDPALQSAIGAYQSALSANPLYRSFLGQALIHFVQLDILNHLTGKANH